MDRIMLRIKQLINQKLRFQFHIIKKLFNNKSEIILLFFFLYVLNSLMIKLAEKINDQKLLFACSMMKQISLSMIIIIIGFIAYQIIFSKCDKN